MTYEEATWTYDPEADVWTSIPDGAVLTAQMIKRLARELRQERTLDSASIALADGRESVAEAIGLLVA